MFFGNGLEFCQNVNVTGVTINNPHSPNTDGINPESCRYVHISDCHISVGDDCITIKSGKDVQGRTRNMAAENYTITNCTMLSGHGGVVIGSEMSGGVKKIAISNCIFDGTDRGIMIKTQCGRGGVVEDIRVVNIIMKNIREQAIVLDMEYGKVAEQPLGEKTPQFRNIRFSNITAYTNQAILINGIREMPVQEISLLDVVFETQIGIMIKNARDIELHHVHVNVATGSALQVENADRVDIESLTSAKPTADPLVRLLNVRDVMIQNCWPFAGTRIFADIRGAATKNIKFLNNELGDATVVVADEVKKEEVRQ